jgi:predicted phage tail protein
MSRGSRQYFDMEQTVRLLGDLGERYGAKHVYYDLRTPADAIKLLCINKPAFQEELIHAHENGVGYRLIQAGTDLDYADLKLPLGSNDLILTPVITGSGGGGTGKILAGIGLVAFAIVTAGLGAGFLGAGLGLTAGTFTLGAAASTAIGAIGASLILGGVSQMLSPQPTIPKPGSYGGGNRLGSGDSLSTDGPQSITRGSDGKQSYAYTGSANTVGVGATVPVAYGEVLIGSHLLSANVDITDESDPLKNFIKEPGPNTILIGGENITDTVAEVSGIRTRTWAPSQVNFGASTTFEKILTLSNGNEVKYTHVDAKEDSRHENLQVFFELDRGLFNFVSGAGSTLVDGFITYEVEVVTQVSGQPDPVTANIRSTIQGLLTGNQTYRFCHYIRYAKIEDGAGNLRISIKIIDFKADSSCRLKTMIAGYTHFFDESKNEPAVKQAKFAKRETKREKKRKRRRDKETSRNKRRGGTLKRG